MTRLQITRTLKKIVSNRTFSPTDFDDPITLMWSKGYSRFCEFRGPEDYWQAPTETVQGEQFFRQHYNDAHGLVWVRLSTQTRDGRLADLDHFVSAALPTIQRPFILITSDGDISVPSELRIETFNALMDCPFLVAWYTQNHDGSESPRISPLPIGLDLHTPRPFSSPRALVDALKQTRVARAPIQKQPLRLFCDIGLSLASTQRIEAMQALKSCKHVDILRRRVSQQKIWRLYSNYPFVLSLAGNAVDCHRTWEALYLGSIVITKSSAIDPLFEGLPVVLIQEWSELLDRSNFIRWLEKFAPSTNMDLVWNRLDPQAWMNELRLRLTLDAK